ncbi:unnamed protein product [Lepeophtheirus salmonis]|uniref:(salmon louse) hypothetical protein n=1 Tax=Lepeophtheirus salmonis TaxID=72036 RepID=A0A7R8CHG8_LEPSM|nr:unnamed protein product [Lepeophtheirus salmonis]CAF2818739.1 unnamed protein product [Lepeophtheirus salmonis]
MEKEIVICQEEGSSSVGEETGDCPIREKPIVEVGKVPNKKSSEPSTSSSISQSDLLPLILPLVLEQFKSLVEKRKTGYTTEDSCIRGATNFFLKKNLIKFLQEDVFSPRDSLSNNDYKNFVQEKFLLEKESHDALELVGANTE